jgi:hypothetical protein
MSDPAAEPGAPTGGATNIPAASEKSIAAEVKERVPNRLLSVASTPDQIILRLNKYGVATIKHIEIQADHFRLDCWPIQAA